MQAIDNCIIISQHGFSTVLGAKVCPHCACDPRACAIIFVPRKGGGERTKHHHYIFLLRDLKLFRNSFSLSKYSFISIRTMQVKGCTRGTPVPLLWRVSPVGPPDPSWSIPHVLRLVRHGFRCSSFSFESREWSLHCKQRARLGHSSDCCKSSFLCLFQAPNWNAMKDNHHAD